MKWNNYLVNISNAAVNVFCPSILRYFTVENYFNDNVFERTGP